MIGHVALLRTLSLALFACTLLLAGEDAFPRTVVLRSPLTTLVEAPQRISGDRRLRIELEVPSDAPADLSLGACAIDRDGRWFQTTLAPRLRPGVHRFIVDLGGGAVLDDPGARSRWSTEQAAVCVRSGICLWSARPGGRVTVRDLAAVPASPHADRPQRLIDLAMQDLGRDGTARGRTGERWSLTLRPDPWPANPFDPDLFRLDLLVTAPDGQVLRLPGFARQPTALSDRGDREDADPAGPGHFAARFRPRLPGRHRLRLAWSVGGGSERLEPLPDLVVAGEPRDEVMRVDQTDPRFFQVAGNWYWPIGLNLHSTFDKRSLEVNKTILTPARGSLVYAAMIDRLAAAGGDATELWMSAWNLALEWRADWPGYQGIGRYAQGNAERLDRILDHAWVAGVRINLVINNHGQAAPATDREWKDNPWNERLGGPLAEPIEIFDHPAALAGQERLRRYLIARYADHPAVLGWKLWSEVDLTAARGAVVPRWHKTAADRWHDLDVYGHPVTTHWAGDFRRVNPEVAELPEIDYLCIDAYRRAGNGGTWRLLADILADSTQYPHRGLSRYKKPCLATEFGAGSGASPESCRAVDHRTGAWAAAVTGHAGAPMLWWWEWVDQGGRWAPYGAIRRFLAGEDLRGTDARCVELVAGQAGGELWCRAWVRPGRLYAYIQDPDWGSMGGDPARISGAWLEIASQVEAGRLQAEWWDCDTGSVVNRTAIDHAGGALRLACPPFAGHLALKFRRGGTEP
jgi:hypothetical protein